MRILPWLGGLILAGMVATISQGAENHLPVRRDLRPTAPLSRFCDPVCELQAQDAAFGILVEVYREHQAYRIEYDYQIRQIQARDLKEDGSSLVIESDSKALRKLRAFVLALAQSERDARLAAMETQVANFRSAYGCVRKIDEDYVGEKVPVVFTPASAREKIKEFVVISPGTLAKGGLERAPSISAETVLWDAPLGPVNSQDLVEPCD